MDPAIRKRTLRLMSNGMYVMTSSYGDHHGAATLTWLSQASFKPPLVMAAVRPASNVFQCLAESRVAAIHILDAAQQEMAQRFFCPTRVVDGTINGEPFSRGMTGVPILAGARAHVECEVRHIFDRGDHAVVVLEVIDAQCHGDINPLTVAASPWEYGG